MSIAKVEDEAFKKTGKLLPLQGIPIVVKDNYNTKGMPTTGGSLALNDFIPKTNAFVINKLIKAGAIIIAKTNMAEWAFSAKHTFSSTHGETHNPYNLAYVPAGSSGGTAAAVAANYATAGLGTDTGNSIRGPSSHCDLVGFRTTMGLISRSGIIPLYLRNDVAGPMCRTVEDETKMLQVMAGYDQNDPITKHSKGKIPSNYTQFLHKDGLNNARIGVLRALSDDNPDPQVKALFDKALTDMKSMGAQIVDPVVIPDFDSLRKNQWCSEFRKDIDNYLATYVKSDTMKTIEDIIRVGSKSKEVMKGLKYEATHSGRAKHPEIGCKDAWHDRRRVAFREAIRKTMDKLHLDAIVYPSWNYPPAKIDSFDVDYKGDNSQIIAPHTGQPAFTVPMGYTHGGLPAGIQFLGRMYAEPTLIKLVYAYEQGTQHRMPPSKSELTDTRD
jgi:amidase